MLDNSDRAKELQREYLRNWRRRNKEKVRDYNRAYWERKAQKEVSQDETISEDHGGV